MSKLGGLVASLSTETSEWTKGLTRAERELQSFNRRTEQQLSQLARNIGTGLGLAAVAIAAGFVIQVGQAIKALDDLNVQANRTGLGLAELQKFNYTALLSDASPEESAKALKALTKEIGLAAAGNEKAALKFDGLGVSLKGLDGQAKSSLTVLGDLAEFFSRLPDGPEKSALALSLFGKAGEAVLPILNQGREGLEKLGKEFDVFGLEKSPASIKAAADLYDNIDRLKKIAESAAASLAGPFVDSLLKATQALLEAKKQGSGFIEQVFAAVAPKTARDLASDKLSELLRDRQSVEARNDPLAEKVKSSLDSKIAEARSALFRLTAVADAVFVSGRGSGQSQLDFEFPSRVKQRAEESAKAIASARKVLAKEGEQKAPNLKQITDPFESVFNRLGEDRAALQGGTSELIVFQKKLVEFASAREKFDKQGGKGGAEKQANATLLANENRLIAEQIRLGKENGERLAAVSKIEEESLAVSINSAQALLEENKGLAEQFDLIGKNATEIALYNRLKLEKVLREKEERLLVAQNIEGNEKQVDLLQKEIDWLRLKGTITDAINTKNTNLIRNPFEGLKAGAKDYYEYLDREGDRAREAFGNVAKSLEDSLTKAFETGKFKATDFFKTIQAEVARAAARQVTKYATSQVSSLLDGLFRGAGSIIGSSPQNFDYNQSAQNFNSEIIERSAPVTVTNTFSFTGNVGDVAQQKAFSDAVADRVQGSILDSKYRGGAFA